MGDGERRTVEHRAVSTQLASWSDAEVAAALAGGDRVGAGIGGSTVRIRVLGIPVFVKYVALTDAGRGCGTDGSTANIFDLPTWYSWGAGSAGFGAWREAAAHRAATRWVLDGTCPNFLLLHHHRVLATTPPEAGAGQDAVEFWNGSPAVRDRLEALERASASVVLFLEYVPETVHQWFTRQLTADQASAAAACELLEQQLAAAMGCLRSHGMSHFDAHFRNLLTDGDRIYVSDFGLASSQGFDITQIERDFLEHTADHDLAYVVTQLVDTVVTTVIAPGGPGPRNDYLRRLVRDGDAPGLPAALAVIVRRYAGVVVVMNDFYWDLHAGRPTTPYPAREITRALTAAGVLP